MVYRTIKFFKGCLTFGVGQRQREEECRALVGVSVCPQIALVSQHDMTRNRQPQTRPLAAREVFLIEAFKNAGQMCLVDSRSGIAHTDGGCVAVGSG